MKTESLYEWVLLPMLSDHPTEDDLLGFEPYAKTLAEIIADRNTNTPLTIGIFGGWGQGKTSLMRMVQRRLKATLRTAFPIQSIWFNAWMYSQRACLWRALLSSVLTGVRGFITLSNSTHSNLRQLEARLHQAVLPAVGSITLPVETLPGLDSIMLPPRTGLKLLQRQARRKGNDTHAAHIDQLITDFEESETLSLRNHIAALDDFRREFEGLSRKGIVDHGRLVIFVDDLDRCLPTQAVEVLEAIKIFLDVPGCVFVLGMAQEIVEEGIRGCYSDYEVKLNGAEYLEKIIQIPFQLPPITVDAVSAYIHHVSAKSLPDPRCEKIFAIGLDPNPRRIKRAINIFLLLWRLAQNIESLSLIIKPVRLAKIVIIQQHYPRLFQLLSDSPHCLIDLEKRFRDQKKQDMEYSGREEGSTDTKSTKSGSLDDFLGQGTLHALLTCTQADEPHANFADLTPTDVQAYISLTHRTTTEKLRREKILLPFEPQMIIIPAGPFLMGTPENRVEDIIALGFKQEQVEREVPQHRVILRAYAIGRYPVTNAEFGRFIEDSGYEIPKFWTDSGWRVKERNGWRLPRYWENNRWNGASKPVVGISWYEAVAYCKWLSAKSSKAYRLPSEAEWEKAARGTDGRVYPWGDNWDTSRCNNRESGPGCTTLVGQYPLGDSPYGVSDMVGQVWEWCSSQFVKHPYILEDDRDNLEGESDRVLRGGSWWNHNPAGHCRCSYRNWTGPQYRHYRRGFRCVRELSQSIM